MPRLHRLALACLAPLLLAAAPTSHPAVHVAHDGLKKLAWQLAVPTGTFEDRTVFETIELLHGLDVHHLELTPGQPLSEEKRDAKAGHAMSPEDAQALLAKLKAVHMDVVSYGPVDLGADEASARAVFAFARQLKAKDVIASPKPDQIAMLDKLASEYGVNLALRGMSAADVAKAAEGRSPRTGAYLEVTPGSLVDVKALKGHIAQVRLTGGDVSAEMIELRRQGFKGVTTAAATPGKGDQALADIAASINALSDAVAKAANDEK